MDPECHETYSDKFMSILSNPEFEKFIDDISRPEH